MNSAALNFVLVPALVLHQASDGLFRIAQPNCEMLDFTGLDPADLIGLRASELFPGRVGALFEAHQATAAEGQIPQSCSCSVDLPVGHRTIEARICPVVEHAEVRTIVCTMLDRTDQQTLREEREQTVADRMKMLSEIERFISMAAHDLRSPMRRVQFLTEMLREDFIDFGDGKVEMIDMLEEVSIKSLELIGDVLNYARARDVEHTSKEFDLASLCVDIFTTLDPESRHDLACPSVALVADRTVMQIALRNLIDNALKHGKRDRITLKVEPLAANDSMIEIVVIDDGRGFADPELAFLEGKEFRYGGGFGLMGVKHMIVSRAGTIWVTKRPAGQGAEIHFTLPGRIAGAPQAPDPGRLCA